MNRRTLLTALGGGTAVATAGCLSLITDEREAVHFELWNSTDEEHNVEVTITHDDDEILSDSYTIGPADSDDTPGGSLIEERDIATASNDDVIVLEVTLNGETDWGHQVPISCSGEDQSNLLIAEVEAGEEYYIDFDGSVCT